MKEKKERIKKAWEMVCRSESVNTQRIIRNNVLNGVDFTNAVRSQGKMFAVGYIDSKLARKMFDNDELVCLNGEHPNPSPKGTVQILKKDGKITDYQPRK